VSRPPHRVRPARDEGTVLLLIIGLVTVVALLVAVVTDVSSLYLHRRELIAAADGAALAGAQAVDEAAIYRDGLPTTGPVPLDPDAARQAVHRYLDQAGLGDVDVQVEATTTTVTVRLAQRYRLPVASTVSAGTTGAPAVTASATARTAVILG
jgi:uncharacterized membrane protein